MCAACTAYLQPVLGTAEVHQVARGTAEGITASDLSGSQQKQQVLSPAACSGATPQPPRAAGRCRWWATEQVWTC